MNPTDPPKPSTATPAPAPAPAAPSTTTVTLALTLTYEAKDAMTMPEFLAESSKAQAIVDGLKKSGRVTGAITIGKQKFRV